MKGKIERYTTHEEKAKYFFFVAVLLSFLYLYRIRMLISFNGTVDALKEILILKMI
jgi:hypothetical protein